MKCDKSNALTTQRATASNTMILTHETTSYIRTISNDALDKKMAAPVRRRRPKHDNAAILQYTHTLELVGDNPVTKNNGGSALGNFMEYLLNHALSIVDDSTNSCSCARDPPQVELQENPGGDGINVLRVKCDEIVVVTDNAKLPCPRIHSQTIDCAAPRRSQSERSDIKRDARWGSLNQRKPHVAGLTAPVRNVSFEYFNLPVPSIPGCNTTNNGRASKAATRKAHSTDTIPSYPRSQRRCSM